MSNCLNTLSPQAALCYCAKSFYDRGWMLGTAGNLSSRSDNEHFYITASGHPKGQLSESDFVLASVDNENYDDLGTNNKPSAETSIHQVIYRLYPEAKACFHVHSVDACFATCNAIEEFALPNLEMIKGFDIWKETPNINLPVFDNYLEVPKISEEIEKRFSQKKPALDALMIKNHGVTVWGASIQQAFNRVEILEFILSYAARSVK